ncbi:MAG: Cys-tRNA(Pro) deacylase [Oscillospiraceae bacterium]|nr:Cys-tRNA(Pro) deacylase [Oscillospiraceae bacterium]
MAVKTNAMRILDKAGISYVVREYPHGDEAVDGLRVAELLGQDVNEVYKTLVTKAAKNYYVFVIPVGCELDLKAAARAVGEKSVEMIHVKDINSVTGYIRGGCSPVGMKKLFRTVFHSDIEQLSHVMVSGGKIGLQIQLAPSDLISTVSGITADIVKH